METERSERIEHLIVGGGVIGLSIAVELLRRDRGVVVVDRGRAGGAATAAAGGMLAPISEAEVEPATMIELGRDSLGRYPEFVERLERITGLSCRYRSHGTLWVARDRDDLAELQHLEQTLRDKGLEAREVGGDEVRLMEPHLSGRVLGGLHVGSDHQIDPRSLTRCLERAVRALGGQIVSGAVVDTLETSGGRVSGVSGKRDNGRPFAFDAESIVVAAGAWSTETVRLPDDAPRARPIKGQLVRLCGPRLIEHVVRTPDVYLVPRADGELLVGATMEEMGYDTTATAGAVMDLLRHAWEVLPGTYELELTEISVGMRSAVDDHLPVIGAGSVDGLFLAYGHYRSGVLLAPATAHHLVETMLDGAAPAVIAPFDPRRATSTGQSRAV